MGTKLLHCDNDDDYAEGFRTAAMGLGVEVVSLAHGEEAASVFQDGRFDAVVMDCVMDVIDGFHSLQLLRAIDPDVRYLFLTNFKNTDSVARQCREYRVQLKRVLMKSEAGKDVRAVLEALKEL